jgi:ABC-type sugar transport system ATPase subunit
VSQNTPLLANLDIIENISLIKEAHEHMPTKEAQALAMGALERLGYGRIAHRRSADCTIKELLVAQLVRASMLHYAKIIIIRPFVMLKDTEEITMLLETLRGLKDQCDCTVLDMRSNRSKYEAGGDACHIIG